MNAALAKVLLILLVLHSCTTGMRFTVTLDALRHGGTPLEIGLMLSTVALFPAFLAVKAGRWLDDKGPRGPLTLAVAPFIARIVETSLREVDKGLIEAAQSMGATNLQIVMKILLPEAMPGIVSGLTISIIALIGYSAMAGAIGGGGLGDLGIRRGLERLYGRSLTKAEMERLRRRASPFGSAASLYLWHLASGGGVAD